MMTNTDMDKESSSASNVDLSKPGQETKILPIASVDKSRDVKVKGSRKCSVGGVSSSYGYCSRGKHEDYSEQQSGKKSRSRRVCHIERRM